MEASEHGIVIVAWNHSNIKHYFYSFDSLINKIKSYKQCFYDWNITVLIMIVLFYMMVIFRLYCEDHTLLFGGEK